MEVAGLKADTSRMDSTNSATLLPEQMALALSTNFVQRVQKTGLFLGLTDLAVQKRG